MDLTSAAPGPVLVLGANSAIARAACQELARRGHPLVLAGRNLEELEQSAADLRDRYGKTVAVEAFDAAQTDGHADMIHRVDQAAEGLQGVLLAFGYLGDPVAAAVQFDEAATIIDANFTGAVSILTHCAEVLKTRPGGFIIGISSVAADRGRQSNYVYGAAKAGLETFLSGLRNRLHRHGVRVITVKPGFVDTPMTAGRARPLFVASPQEVGRRVIEALDGSADVIYTPWFKRLNL